MKTSKLRSNAGISLVETMIAMGLISVTLLSQTSISEIVDKKSSWADSKMSFERLVTDVNFLIRNPDHCTSTLAGSSFDPAQLPHRERLTLRLSSDPNSTSVAREGQSQDGYTIDTFRLEILNAEPTPDLYAGQLVLQATRQREGYGSRTLVTQPIPVRVYAPMSGAGLATISGCSAGASFQTTHQKISTDYQFINNQQIINNLDLTFELRAPSNVTISAKIAAVAVDCERGIRIGLYRPNQVIPMDASGIQSPGSNRVAGTVHLQWSGILQPGQHRFFVHAAALCGGATNGLRVNAIGNQTTNVHPTAAVRSSLIANVSPL